ncbi:putative hydrolethalus syndrome protein 1 [Apostichopus japonicus]|uniref:Putative hydrolethalus syndrome protein 1 n=1 Tax=Stichopus japonicus TaxID=307972 RepID=A0A2G8LMI4_STIJA|nr:putative hydrolethalus syndrome protein 1 [Apostichopus japonicus]
MYKVNNSWKGFDLDLKGLISTLGKNQFPSHLIDKVVKSYLQNKVSPKNIIDPVSHNTRFYKLPYIEFPHTTYCGIMAGSGFQPLSRGEVAEQLNALGYKNFSPEKIKQITEDLAAYLADEGLLTDTSDQSYLSASSAQYSPTNNSPRAPLQDVRESSHHHQQFVRFDHPDSYGKENFSERDFIDQKAFSDEVSVDDSSEQSYRQDEGHMSRPAAKSKPLIKRKVVRKRNGQAQIFDESITESESDISYLNDRLAELHLPLRGEKPQEEYAESEASTITQTYQAKRRPKSASSSRWSDGGSSQTSERYSNQPLKSFIRPSTAPVKWKHDRKTDPVTRQVWLV